MDDDALADRDDMMQEDRELFEGDSLLDEDEPDDDDKDYCDPPEDQHLDSMWEDRFEQGW